MNAILKQMRKDCRIGQELHIGAVAQEDDSQWTQYWDDVSGALLEREGVEKARAEEMMEFRKHNVYTKVPLTECWDKTGKAPIKTRWLDINKGEKVHPDYRSRFVAKDFNDGKRMDLFAATHHWKH